MKFFCTCSDEFQVKKNGARFIERTETGVPYAIWNADLMECRTCGKMFYRTADRPFMCRFEEGFQEMVEILEKGEKQ